MLLERARVADDPRDGNLWEMIVTVTDRMNSALLELKREAKPQLGNVDAALFATRLGHAQTMPYSARC